MKSIKFTDDELDFVRQQYQAQLEEAQKYVQNLKNIIKKIGSPKSAETVEIPEKKRRGRKPKIQKEESLAPGLVKKGRKPRTDKGKKRGIPAKSIKVEKTTKETPLPSTPSKVEAKAVQPPKPLVPKKKVKKYPKKRKGVFLTKLSKPLPQKEEPKVEPEILPLEVKPETTE